ncbi:hypothetical protein MRB53_025052 [Persea americana]|uniref:Uncharacterized protein n=1 Tax=Persea americana TaxID=3435 RepID=A0ACC2LE62_PERAE|nr:hypothetical protein MRB53_025052 [Persea americana]
MLSTEVEDARTPPQPGNMGIETSIVPWEAPEPTRKMPEWLPECWTMKVMARKNGKTARVKNQFYYDLEFHHHTFATDGLMTARRRYKGGPDV